MMVWYEGSGHHTVLEELSHYLQLLAIGLTSSTWSKSIVYVVGCVIVHVAMGMMVTITLGGLLTLL